ncbi:MAG TPA: MarR family transcriptional regulator [Caulobacteraceae bacterium]
MAADAEDLGLLGRRLSTAIVLYHTALAEALGLNLTDFKCLDLLIRRGDFATPGQLSVDAGLSSATTTLVLDRLETKGLVRREADPGDRRRTILRVILSQALIDGFQHATRGMRERMAELATAFTESELGVIGRYLDGAAGAIEASLGEMRSGMPADGGKAEPVGKRGPSGPSPVGGRRQTR